jgi:hypothetical protein
MLVLPQKSLDQSNNLLDLGRSISSLLRSEEGSKPGWFQNIYHSIPLFLLRPFMRKKLAELTKKVESVTPLVEVANWEGRTAQDYESVRNYRDKTASIIAKLNKPEHREEMKFLEADFKNYLRVSTKQLDVLDQFLGRLNPATKTTEGFTSVNEKDLWSDRSKGYKYVV